MMGNFGLLALALTAVPVQESTDFERFQLFNNCEPMSLVVRLNITKGETGRNLTKERLQFAAESRLRGARLFKADAPGLLRGKEHSAIIRAMKPRSGSASLARTSWFT